MGALGGPPSAPAGERAPGSTAETQAEQRGSSDVAVGEQLAWWQARAAARTDGRRAEQSPKDVAGWPVACALRLRFVQGPGKVGAWPGAQSAQVTPHCSVESQVPCRAQACSRDRRRQGWKGPQVGVTLCQDRRGASPQAPSPKSGEGDSCYSSWPKVLRVSEATGQTRCFILPWGEQAFFLQKK